MYIVVFHRLRRGYQAIKVHDSADTPEQQDAV